MVGETGIAEGFLDLSMVLIRLECGFGSKKVFKVEGERKRKAGILERRQVW